MHKFNNARPPHSPRLSARPPRSACPPARRAHLPLHSLVRGVRLLQLARVLPHRHLLQERKRWFLFPLKMLVSLFCVSSEQCRACTVSFT